MCSWTSYPSNIKFKAAKLIKCLLIPSQVIEHNPFIKCFGQSFGLGNPANFNSYGTGRICKNQYGLNLWTSVCHTCHTSDPIE